MSQNTKETANNALFAAIVSGNIGDIEIAIAQGADIKNARLFTLAPLMVAAQWGKKDIVLYLLKHDVDINVQDSKSGYTALHHAIDYPDVVRVLLEYGANYAVKTNSGHTPRSLALKNGSFRTRDEVKRMLEEAEEKALAAFQSFRSLQEKTDSYINKLPTPLHRHIEQYLSNSIPSQRGYS